MTNWFIMAAGSADRCDGDCKHLYLINGEPIIRRTIRLINRIDPLGNVYLVTWRQELIDYVRSIPDTFTIVIPTGVPTSCLNESMLLTEKYWGNRNAILTGDAIFSDYIIRLIYDYSGTAQCYGRYTDKEHGGPERYALTFGRNDIPMISKKMRQCLDHPLCNEVPCCITRSLWIPICVILNRIARPINKLLYAKTPAGILGWIYCNTYFTSYLSHRAPMVEIDDPRVRDVDTIKELEYMNELWRGYD